MVVVVVKHDKLSPSVGLMNCSFCVWFGVFERTRTQTLAIYKRWRWRRWRRHCPKISVTVCYIRECSFGDIYGVGAGEQGRSAMAKAALGC